MSNRTFIAIRRIMAMALATGLTASLLPAQTRVANQATGLWKAETGPYIVAGEVIVPANEALVIAPGTIIKFESGASLSVQGKLVAKGEATRRIVFTSLPDQEFGAMAAYARLSAPTAKDWKGIRFSATSASDCVMDFCIVRYSQEGVDAKFARPQLINLIFSDCQAAQIIVDGQPKAVANGISANYNFISPSGVASPQLASLGGVEGNLNDPLSDIPTYEFGEIGLENFYEVHGYFDAQFEVDNKDAAGKISDFDVQRFNIVTIFNMSERATALAEIEYEHGIEHSGGDGVGEINLERGYLQLKLTENHNLLIGKFLTPYGIYNLIHDYSATYLFTKLPFSLYDKHLNAVGKKERDHPKYLAGVQLNGNFPLPNGNVEYYAYVANGAGAKPFEEDDNTNKALGLRLRYADGLERVKIGASFFRGKNGNAAHTLQQLLAADLEVNAGNFKVQFEGTSNQFDRLGTNGAKTGSPRKALGFYVQGSLSLSGRFYPFLRYDRYDPDGNASNDAESDVTAGLNIGVMKDVFLKFENHFRRGQSADFASHELFVASIAAGF